MSTTFYGRASTGKTILLDVGDPTFLNVSCANARAFLGLLGLEPGDEPSGEVTLPEARRAVIRARATFERRVSGYTRVSSDTKLPGRCRVIEGGIDADYFELRLDHFELFLDVVAGRGATSVVWT